MACVAKASVSTDPEFRATSALSLDIQKVLQLATRYRAEAAMRGLPFAAYDFFAYLIPGGLCLLFWDFLFNRSRIYGFMIQGGVVWGIGVLLLAYVVGQVLAGPANTATVFWYEMMLRHRPIESRKLPWWHSGLMPLPEEIRASLIAKAQAEGVRGESDYNVLYYLALSNYLAASTPPPEIGGYQNLSGFCQYMSVGCGLCLVMLAIAAPRDGLSAAANWTIAIVLAVCGLFLYFRYVRSYYRYMVRLYLLYLRSSTPNLPNVADRGSQASTLSSHLQ
jgi:hypothetical protein